VECRGKFEADPACEAQRGWEGEEGLRLSPGGKPKGVGGEGRAEGEPG